MVPFVMHKMGVKYKVLKLIILQLVLIIMLKM